MTILNAEEINIGELVGNNKSIIKKKDICNVYSYRNDGQQSYNTAVVTKIDDSKHYYIVSGNYTEEIIAWWLK